ncbi:hypothetical protein U9M48_003346 [Paspalum notatum var. saurae]|uniref:Uncharacterized protein n=1 Tax=Paspalum notatum var. saurae TaxID=547442 RepID=A0AAQ3PH93_PASNO
MDQRKSNR